MNVVRRLYEEIFTKIALKLFEKIMLLKKIVGFTQLS